jgi:hypothetical protein
MIVKQHLKVEHRAIDELLVAQHTMKGQKI